MANSIVFSTRQLPTALTAPPTRHSALNVCTFLSSDSRGLCAIGCSFSCSPHSGLGLAFQPFGPTGVHWDAIKLELNLYTGPGFMSALFGVINLILLIAVFREYRIYTKVKQVTCKTCYTSCVKCCSKGCARRQEDKESEDSKDNEESEESEDSKQHFH